MNRESHNLARMLWYEWHALRDMAVTEMSVSHPIAEHITASDSGCCECIFQRFPCQPGTCEVTHLLRLPVHSHCSNKPWQLRGGHAVKAPLLFCCKVIQISRLLKGWWFWKAPHMSAGSILCSAVWLYWKQAFLWSKHFLIFVRKFSHSCTCSPPPSAVRWSLLHLKMWVSVSCLGCSLFCVLFSAGSQVEGNGKIKRAGKDKG